jgi:hypothetical protein
MDMRDFAFEMSFAEASWLLALLYLVHYLEEGPRLVKWFALHSPQRKLGLSYTQEKLNLENILMFSMLIAMVVLINVFPENALLRSLILGACVGFLENTLFHAIPTLITGIYSPGLVTACMFNPAVCALLFFKAGEAGALGAAPIAAALAFGTAILPLTVLLTHKVLMPKR